MAEKVKDKSLLPVQETIEQNYTRANGCRIYRLTDCAPQYDDSVFYSILQNVNILYMHIKGAHTASVRLHIDLGLPSNVQICVRFLLNI